MRLPSCGTSFHSQSRFFNLGILELSSEKDKNKQKDVGIGPHFTINELWNRHSQTLS